MLGLPGTISHLNSSSRWRGRSRGKRAFLLPRRWRPGHEENLLNWRPAGCWETVNVPSRLVVEQQWRVSRMLSLARKERPREEDHTTERDRRGKLPTTRTCRDEQQLLPIAKTRTCQDTSQGAPSQRERRYITFSPVAVSLLAPLLHPAHPSLARLSSLPTALIVLSIPTPKLTLHRNHNAVPEPPCPRRRRPGLRPLHSRVPRVAR